MRYNEELYGHGKGEGVELGCGDFFVLAVPDHRPHSCARPVSLTYARDSAFSWRDVFTTVFPYHSCILSFQYNIIFQKNQSFEPPSSPLGGIDICACRHFCTKFSSEQLLFEPFFDGVHIFGSAEP